MSDDGRVDLADFLLARIAEDEALARAAAADVITMGRSDGETWHARDYEHEGIGVNGWPDEGKSYGERTPVTDQITAWSPARVLAECEAKRRIVGAHPLTSLVVPVHTGPQPEVGCETCHTVTAASVTDPDYVEALGPCETLLALALPYADHPDYDEAWRP